MKAVYETSAAKANQLPPISIPEFAFIGRSNVGKSSLLNALLNHKGLARSSATPGRTQMANFFRVNDQYYFVDLPGYGYSAAANKDHKDWQNLMETYFNRSSIARFLFLWDPRRELNQIDFDLLKRLAERAELSLILTKCDKLARSERASRINFISNSLKSSGVPLRSIHEVSCLTKEGIKDLIEELIGPKS